MKLTSWGRQAKARLKNRECYPALFENQLLAEEGNRDTTLLKCIGQVIGLTYPGVDCGIPGTTPEHIYGLFLDACLSMGKDQDGIPWEDKAWDMILRLWAEEEQKYKDTLVAAREQAAKKLSLAESILRGMREWCPEPGLHAEDKYALEWVSNHLIASWGKHSFVMRPTGYYDPIPVTSTQLIARIRELGMDTAINLTRLRATGAGLRAATAQELINDHATIISAVEGVVDAKGGTVSNMGTQYATLSIGMYGRREDIQPEYNAQVADWLQQLCYTEEDYLKLCNWIGHALAFENGPICALSMAGPPGCGKKMLAWGLAECITTGAVADAKEFGKFASQLMRTPFLLVNEGFPQIAGAKDPADTFRAFTSGDPIDLERKFHDSITLRSPLRVMIFANNLRVLRTLTAHRDLSPDDRDALAQRLLHIDVPPSASNWLRGMGGLQHTGQPGQRWIRGDDGSRSDNIVARHFLYLHANREPVPRENRLLVEGDRHADVIRLLSTQSGFAPEIIETIVDMVERREGAIPGLAIIDRDIYVTISGVVNHHRNFFYKTSGNALRAHSVNSVLRGLMSPNWDPTMPRILTLESGKKSLRASWWKLKADTLYREACDNGYRCTELEQIVNPMVSKEEKAKLEQAIKDFEAQ